ncbi:MAG: insulinase family protein, partial [Acidobacteria bacterium ACB2]|nr:insulinase family protein [Acidobacteria bacterium ACB2]
VEFEKYTLPNGLQVILHVDRKLPIVHVNQWYHVGSKNEKPGRTGFAHLFEHLMFQGSKNVPGEYFDHVEKAGANLREGGVNGTTNNDRTNYFATVPSGNLELLLWLESDRLATLGEALTKESLDNQRDVVKNERRQGLENQPYGRAWKLLYEAVYPTGHPYSWPVIGSHEDLTAASLDDAKEFFRQYYTPNNLSLAITGDFDPAEAKRLVEKYFGPIPPGPALDRPKREPVRLEAEKVFEVADRVPQERTYMVWAAVPYFAPGDAELDLAARVLSEGLSSRLNKALVYDRQLATNVNAFNDSNEIAGGFVVIATARPGVPLETLEEEVGKEIARLAKEGPTSAELQRAQTKYEYDFVTALEGIGGFGGKADRLNQYNVLLGDPGKLDADLGRYRAATPESVRAAVATYLDTRNRALIRFRPETSQRPPASTLDRTKAPAAGADRPFTAPSVKSAKLPNGLEVLVVERPELPKVSAALVARAGAVADPPGKEGTAYLATMTIDMGTKTRKALEIEDALGDLGTGLSGSPGREASVVSLEVLKRNLAPALSILADVVQNPTYPESEIAREKKRHLDSLSQEAKNPNALAGRLAPMLAFGASHPYGRPGRGLPSTVEKIGRDDLAAFHAARFRPGSSALVFVGDVTLAEATELAKKAFGGWAGGAAPAVAIPAPAPAPAGKVYLVDRPDAAQTVISQLLPAPKRKSPDYYALRMADAVYGGGGFGTRLNLNLREEKGYSYGVFSNLALLSEAGFWTAGGGVQTAKTKESLVEFDAELKGVAGAKPISEAEFDGAKKTRLRGYAQQFESLGRVTEQVASLWVQRLPFTQLQEEVSGTAAVTLAAANAAAKAWAVPAKAAYLLVGDAAKVRPGVEELKLGDVVLLDVEGKPVTR